MLPVRLGHLLDHHRADWRGAEIVAAEPQLQLHRFFTAELHPTDSPAAPQGSPDDARRSERHMVDSAGDDDAVFG